MKVIRLLAAVALLCAVSAVSYWCGYHNSDTKNHQAACMLSDFIRFTIDQWQGEEIWNGGLELENSYEEYFQDSEYLTVKELENYSCK